MNENKVIFLQRRFRFNKLGKCIKEIRNLNLLEKCDYFIFKKKMIDKDNINIFNSLIIKLKNIYNFNNISPKEIFTGYLFNLYPQNFFGDPKNLNNLDNSIFDWSKQLINILEKEQFNNLKDFKKLNTFFVNYNEIFKKWKEMDKNRSIEGLIMSYYNRREHEKQNQDDRLEDYFKNEYKKIFLIIKIIDPSFNCEYLEKNYEEIYLNLKKGYEYILDTVKDTFTKAYFDFLKNELIKDNKKPIYDLIEEINTRILLITPKTFKNSIEKKLKNEDIINLILDNDWNSNLQNYILFIIDTLIVYSAPADEKKIQILRNKCNEYFEKDYLTTFPLLLIEINQYIDRIYELILDLQSNK